MFFFKRRNKAVSLEISRGVLRLPGGFLVNFPAVEKIGMIRASLQRQNLASEQTRVITVTSAVPGEGKSMISVNLARSFASFTDSSVLLIDGDIRKPTVHSFFNIPGSPGLIDLLSQRTTSDVVPLTVEPRLHVIASGQRSDDSGITFDPKDLTRLLGEFSTRYSYIIIDAPPILLCPEPVMLSSVTDGTLLVVRGWRTQRNLVRQAVNAVGREKLLGIILNDLDDEIHSYGYYGYYGRNYDRSKEKRLAANG